MSQNQQNNQKRQPSISVYQQVRSTTQIHRSMRHKNQLSKNYPVIHSGIHITNKNYNGIKTISTRNYRLISAR